MLLEMSVDSVTGIKKERKAQLGKLGIFKVRDLLDYFPRAYEDRSVTKNIMELLDEQKELVTAVVSSAPTFRMIRKNLSVVKVMVHDDSGKMNITFFNQKYMQDNLKEGEAYSFFGKVKRSTKSVEMINPIVEKIDVNRHTGNITPIYSLTKGLTQKVFYNIMSTIVSQTDSLTESLPDYIRQEYKLCDIAFAYQNIHTPKDFHSLELARQRLIFEELLLLQLGLLKLKNINGEKHGISFINFKIAEKLADKVPFELTNAQKRVIRECCIDIRNGKQLNRLIQGDVGSGKTIVACAMMLISVENGCQSALMAPTEILAEQHYTELKGYFEDFGYKTALLTGSTTKKNKNIILEGLKTGEIDILIGTHSIIESDVEFKNLGLTVTDEQHRFGVLQRNALYEKGKNPHVLVMTATPIPRTLSLIMYSDLDLSIIDELPPGRQRVDTFLVSESDRKKIYSFMNKELKNGSQIYVVCPLVEESDKMADIKNATFYKEELQNLFPLYNIGLLHGKLKGKEKDEIMHDFKDKKIDILVSTTVIEVGVNVPNATAMIIENAERFGLAQLHQLRGRVGRGNKKSYCILVCGNKNDTTMDRMRIMIETSDGFKISEKDLEIRGAGYFFGKQQSGFMDLKIANLFSDIKTLELAAKVAKNILMEDRTLSEEKNKLLYENVTKLFMRNGVDIFN